MIFLVQLIVLSVPFVISQQCKGGASCITINECTGILNILKNGNTPELTKLLKGLHCGFYNTTPKICCPPEFLPSEITIEKSVERNNSLNLAMSLLPSDNICGIGNDDRLVGGNITGIDEHPWMALLRYDKPFGWDFHCGGVLISAKYVLTAAHCVNGTFIPEDWKLSQVRLGEWNTTSDVDCDKLGDCSEPVQDIPIEKAIAHESYNPSSRLNDIALLRLSTNAKYSDFVQPICLPLSDYWRQNNYDDYEFTVVGWGRTESRARSDVKLKLLVPYKNRTQCADLYRKSNQLITVNQMCAGGDEGKNTCSGDSGGGLMGNKPQSNDWVVAGIVSYGPTPCAKKDWPSVYTRVAAYIDWILTTLRL